MLGNVYDPSYFESCDATVVKSNNSKTCLVKAMGKQKCCSLIGNKPKLKLEICKCVLVETVAGSNLLTDVREEEKSAVKMRGEAVMWIGDNEVD